MAIKIPQLNIGKIGNKTLAVAKSHIVLIWAIFGFSLLIYASYIYYHQIYTLSSEQLSPTVQLPIAQKTQLNQILEDLDEREKRQQEPITEKTTDPFAPQQ